MKNSNNNSEIVKELNILVDRLSSLCYKSESGDDIYFRIKYDNNGWTLEECFLSERNEWVPLYIYSNSDINMFRTVLKSMVATEQRKALEKLGYSFS